MIGRIVEHYGRRRSILVIIGIVWILIGLSVILEPHVAPISGVPHTYIPEPIRFALWALSGVIAIASSIRSSESGRGEALGFAALYLMPAERVLSYLIAWISALDVIPGEGLERGWLYAAQHAAYVGVIYICAGWTEPRKEVLL